MVAGGLNERREKLLEDAKGKLKDVKDRVKDVKESVQETVQSGGRHAAKLEGLREGLGSVVRGVKSAVKDVIPATGRLGVGERRRRAALFLQPVARRRHVR